jgi:hypothetical protein
MTFILADHLFECALLACQCIKIVFLNIIKMCFVSLFFIILFFCFVGCGEKQNKSCVYEGVWQSV